MIFILVVYSNMGWRVMKKEICSLAFYRDICAEFVATFMLMSVQCALPLSWIKNGAATSGGSVQTGVGMGFIVATMAWTLGEFSGGHLNPAVSISFMLSAKITILRAFFYVSAQCGGAILGALFIKAVTPPAFRDGLAATGLGTDVQPWQGFLIEMWITCILLLTIFGSTDDRRKAGRTFMPTIFIGFAIALGIMSAFSSTGGSMNPARSLGPAVAMGIWRNHWVYWAGPVCRGILAAFLYWVVFDLVGRPKEQNQSNQISDNGYDNAGGTLPSKGRT